MNYKEVVWREMRKYCKRLARRGYVTAHGGNVSVRSGNEIYITRHASSLEDLRLDDIVVVRLDSPTYADAISSTETIVHREVYRVTGHRSIMHSHPPYSIALSYFFNRIKPIDVEGGYVLKEIPVVEGRVGSKKLAERVSKALSNYHAVIVRGHGVFTAASFLDTAYQLTCMVEHSCKILYLVEVLKGRISRFIVPTEL